MRVLGIETSCDETGVAIYDSEQGLVADLLYSQVELHERYGGVVPELASRDHIIKCLPMIDLALRESKTRFEDLDGIAYTQGPGLVGALLVGASIAQSLALALDIPAIGVHHMEGHLLASQLTSKPPEYPFVALLISGGHTQLMACHQAGSYELLGESIDDAAGEAFDKTAKMLGLKYPGGPEIEKLAKKGAADRFTFPRPMTSKPGLNFSFSGLKTHTRNTLAAIETPTAQDKADIARAFQDAAIDTIRIKCERSLISTRLPSLVIAGGVSANESLRNCLTELAIKHNVEIFYPELRFCTDNGAMIAYTGALRLKNVTTQDQSIQVRPRWPMTELETISP